MAERIEAKLRLLGKRLFAGVLTWKIQVHILGVDL